MPALALRVCALQNMWGRHEGAKSACFVVFGVAGLLGVILLNTSQNVQNAEDRLGALQGEIVREEEKILMLQAEWAHLNRPERLEKLAQEFLDLVPPMPDRLLDNGSDAYLSDPVSPDIVEPKKAVMQPVSAQTPKPKPPKKEEPSSEKPKAFNDLLNELSVKEEQGVP